MKSFYCSLRVRLEMEMKRWSASVDGILLSWSKSLYVYYILSHKPLWEPAQRERPEKQTQVNRTNYWCFGVSDRDERADGPAHQFHCRFSSERHRGWRSLPPRNCGLGPSPRRSPVRTCYVSPRSDERGSSSIDRNQLQERKRVDYKRKARMLLTW